MFEPLQPAGEALGSCPAWPDLDAYQRLAQALDHPPATSSGLPLRFVPQGPRPTAFEEGYEPRVYLRGELQTRGENWHDLFNALVWLAFPKAKAAINARHYHLQRERSALGRGRGALQDALTLFDESGVIVVCSNPELCGLLKDFRWKTLFWERRKEVISTMRFVLFGHSLYEKALKPYPGMTGKGLLLPVDEDFLLQPAAGQTAQLDAMLAQTIATPGLLARGRDFSPIPLLGVPGWTPLNEEQSYYEDSRYFRPGRMRDSARS
jgi:hypothetical protein